MSVTGPKFRLDKKSLRPPYRVNTAMKQHYIHARQKGGGSSGSIEPPQIRTLERADKLDLPGMVALRPVCL